MTTYAMMAVVPDGGAEGPGEDRAAEGLAHLQAAARELIHAARAMLDAAEELVDDPGGVGVVAEAVTSVVRTAARAGRRAAGLADESGAASDDNDPPSHVERIKVN